MARGWAIAAAAVAVLLVLVLFVSRRGGSGAATAAATAPASAAAPGDLAGALKAAQTDAANLLLAVSGLQSSLAAVATAEAATSPALNHFWTIAVGAPQSFKTAAEASENAHTNVVNATRAAQAAVNAAIEDYVAVAGCDVTARGGNCGYSAAIAKLTPAAHPADIAQIARLAKNLPTGFAPVAGLASATVDSLRAMVAPATTFASAAVSNPSFFTSYGISLYSSVPASATKNSAAVAAAAGTLMDAVAAATKSGSALQSAALANL